MVTKKISVWEIRNPNERFTSHIILYQVWYLCLYKIETCLTFIDCQMEWFFFSLKFIWGAAMTSSTIVNWYIIWSMQEYDIMWKLWWYWNWWYLFKHWFMKTTWVRHNVISNVNIFLWTPRHSIIVELVEESVILRW